MAIRIMDPGTDTDPYPCCDTGKTCLGGGMHCPSASPSFLFMLEKYRLDRLLGFQLGLTLLLCCC